MVTAGKKQQVAVCQQLSVVLPYDYVDVVYHYYKKTPFLAVSER